MIKFLENNFQPVECQAPLAAIAPVMGAIGSAGAVGGSLGTALTIAGGVFSAIGAIQQGMATKAAADTNAAFSNFNAEVSRKETIAATERQDRLDKIAFGANKAKAGGSGRGIEAFGEVLADNAREQALNIMTIKAKGQLQEDDYRMQGSLAKMEGKSAMTAGYIGAGTSLMNAGSKAIRSGSPAPKPTSYGGTSISGGTVTTKSGKQYSTGYW